jgi:hypothetical protein
MSQWHTVRFVDAPDPHLGTSDTSSPLYIPSGWDKMRGKEVRVRFIGNQPPVIYPDGCDCESFFEIHPDDALRLGINEPGESSLVFECRASFEMD